MVGLPVTNQRTAYTPARCRGQKNARNGGDVPGEVQRVSVNQGEEKPNTCTQGTADLACTPCAAAHKPQFASIGVRRTCTSCSGEQAEPGHRRRLVQFRQAVSSARASSLHAPLTASPSPDGPEIAHHQKLSARAPGWPERRPPYPHPSCRGHQLLRYHRYCRQRRWHQSNQSNQLNQLNQWHPADPPGQALQSRLLASPPSVDHRRSKPAPTVPPKKRSRIS